MHILFLVLLLTVHAAVFPSASVEDIEMDVFDDGPTVTGDAGIGAEFETPLFNFQNSACSLENTFAAKGLTIQGHSGPNYRLSVDTGYIEIGAGKLNPEYVLDGRTIKVGDGSATAAGAAIAADFVGTSLQTSSLTNVFR